MNILDPVKSLKSVLEDRLTETLPCDGPVKVLSLTYYWYPSGEQVVDMLIQYKEQGITGPYTSRTRINAIQDFTVEGVLQRAEDVLRQEWKGGYRENGSHRFWSSDYARTIRTWLDKEKR